VFAKSPMGSRGPTPAETKTPVAVEAGGFSAKEAEVKIATKNIIKIELIDFI
jgi:hypothetical protein